MQLAEQLARSLVRNLKAVRNRRQRKRLMVQTGGAVSPVPAVYFLTPDFDKPAGGIRVIYRQVDYLNATGIKAFVLHQRRGFRCTWFDNQTRVTDAESITVQRGDVLVIPEMFIDVLERIPGDIAYVIFNQGAHCCWDGMDHRVASHYAPGHGLVGVVTVSDHSREMLRYAFPGIDVRRIHVGIDSNLFHVDERPRANRIAYMPRRMPEDAHQVLELLRGRGALDGWEVVELNHMTQAEVAAQLRTTKIFLAFSYQEGFGLPPAEAMACGNYVVGYHGFGGRELFRTDFSAPVPTGDIVAYAKALEFALNKERLEPGWCQAKGALAADFIRSEYSLEREKREVTACYASFLSAMRKAELQPA